MSCRYAIAALLLAAPTPVLAQVPPPPAIGTTLMAPGLRVTDLDRAIAFYRTALGLVEATRLHHGPLTEVMLSADTPRGPLILILLHDDSAGKAPPVVHGDGLAKIVLRVPDVAAVATRLKAAGYPVEAVHQTAQGPAILMLSDPDGYRYELVGNRPPR
ncbi:VOC family protein [Sphingobium sp. KCTC 72723]|jgi:catechol 2,3-dioxygenase-like lactoylglutathione lyase family enzyme|uniref:VOC family protein n=1 Tax=Sphingobium sp. KCTC 72723 TaxID=2733867 RepID=UPI00165DA311|nr:VOC family protein [Sphingobium sp. KCTC 72723]